VFAEFRNPVSIITKNHLVTRDAGLLGELAKHQAARVYISVTTLDPKLAVILEPRTSIPARRLAAIETLRAAGVPVTALVAPVIPGLTDHEIPAIVEAVAKAGATGAYMQMVRLPLAVGPLFEKWLEQHFPERKAKVIAEIRAMRGGKLNDPRFGNRMRGAGILAEQTGKLFAVACRRAGLDQPEPELSTGAFRRPNTDPQLPLL
jgi:DNA repair photolyase